MSFLHNICFSNCNYALKVKIIRKIVSLSANLNFSYHGPSPYFQNVPTSYSNKRSLSSSASLKKPPTDFDVIIVGGGIVGLATGRELINRFPNLRFLLVEKEKLLAIHQSGKNSGVIHAGIYYTPGSLKAKLCVEGLKMAYDYCDVKKIPYNKCGKLIVATKSEEIPRLKELERRGKLNKVPDLTWLEGHEAIKTIEPNCTGLSALHSPHTGIVDWQRVARSFGEDFKALGGQIRCDFEVTGFTSVGLATDRVISVKGGQHASRDQVLTAPFVITCGGLHSDKLAAMTGCKAEPKILPFRGDYFLLKPERVNLVRGNIYPVPDPKFPFLGVHFTPRIDGSVWLGPNAVLSLKREGYSKTAFSLTDAMDSLTYPGMIKLGMKNLKYGFGEFFRAFNIKATVKQLQRFVPSLKEEDVIPGPCGVRAQALNPDGSLVDDFVFDVGEGVLHVRNAPSPACTSSLAIAKMISDEAQKKFNLTANNN